MKQLLQSLKDGTTEVIEVPCPQARAGQLLIQSRVSLISAGSERSLVEFGRSSWLAKARSQPEKVQQVLDKIRTDGLLPTLEAVYQKLEEPMPLGYCNAGVVLEVGPGVTDLQPGDRVASNGPHAEVVCVPRHLCARVPAEVTDEQAAFTVLASVALQGVRLLEPTLGERFMVFGLGLIGQIAVQLLRAHGAEVLGVDVDAERLALAAELGARGVNVAAGGDPIKEATAWTAGKGVDGVLITASAKTDEIIHQSAQACRKRGRVVLVGVVGLNLRRSDFYEKEITFQVSCSYGPGRYDERYEQGGQDYPFGFVRWTEQRNLEAVLGAMARGALQVDRLISHRFAFADAAKAYEAVTGDRRALGVLLEYGGKPLRSPSLSVNQQAAAATGQPVVGVIGAGSFAQMILLPALRKSGARLAYVADVNAVAAERGARKFGGEQAVTDYRLVLADARVDAVLIAVGHHLHARFVCEGLAAGKHVYVEKPLAMNLAELGQVRQAVAAASDRQLMVGFNRRFSPHIVKAKELLRGRSQPLCLTMTVNAGYIPPEHWVHSPVLGGGRIVGEACHFLDLLSFLADAEIRTVAAVMADRGFAVNEDKMSIVLGFADGSVGTVNYFANGAKSYPKEMLTVFSDQRTLQLDNFRVLTGHGFRGFSRLRTLRQDKGHQAEFQAFIARLAQGGGALIPLAALENATRASFAAVESARTGKVISLA